MNNVVLVTVEEALDRAMNKRIYFDVLDAHSWPPPERLREYFLTSKGKEWSYLGENDNWALRAEGVEGPMI